jgi:hypothetical protein
MTVLNLMTAVFWGQLSKCEAVHYNIAQYSCSHTTAYGAVSAFAVLLFLIQAALTAAFVLWRGEIINEAGLYDDISSPSPQSSSSYPYDIASQTSKFPSSGPIPQSADL